MDNHPPFQATMTSPIGYLGIWTSNTHLLGIAFTESTEIIKPKTHLAKETILALQCYFADPRFRIEIPYQLTASPFQQALFNELQTIPPGETRHYSDLAHTLQASARAVGQACRVNPLPIVIPCHRVIAKQGLGGYFGSKKTQNAAIKAWLLTHEQPRAHNRAC